MNAAFCSKLHVKSCNWEQRERRENVIFGLGGELSMGPPEWQPSVLTTTPSNIEILKACLKACLNEA